MKLTSGSLRLAATDLTNHLACPHVTTLNLAHVHGLRTPPPYAAPDLIVIQQRGLEHEAAYVRHLRALGLTVTDLSNLSNSDALAQTSDAMRLGDQVIVQAALQHGPWFGIADVLRRVETPSALGPWSYEPYDCKLARETKAAAILQLSHYAALLENAQRITPAYLYVIPPSPTFEAEPYRTLDYAAYYRAARARLESAAVHNPATAAEPTAHCEVCRWRPDCDREWRAADHLSFTAGITRLQRKQLDAWHVHTMRQLSELPLPIAQKPDYGSRDGYTRIREQARLQVAGRTQARAVHELLHLESGRGLFRLPAPSPGDVFFDLESDPFVGDHGREYLWGRAPGLPASEYFAQWSLTPAEEKLAFESFIDFVIAHWQQHPGLHIYHYGHKEPSTLKALMGRYATREDEIDRMLRAGLLIDLHSIVKQSLRASVEQYSLKDLERFHNFTRQVPLDQAKSAMRQIEHSLELSRDLSPADPARQTVERYNADDCLSTLSLRDWLESIRQSQLDAGFEIPRPTLRDPEPSPALTDRQQHVAAVIAALTNNAPPEEQSARDLLAHLLEFHRRENKVAYWEKFRLADLSDEDLLDERAALAGLQFAHETPPQGRGRIPIHHYSFPPQEATIECGKNALYRGQKIGTIEEVDFAHCRVAIKKTKATLQIHPSSVYIYDHIPTTELENSLLRFAEHVAACGFDNAAPHQSAIALLQAKSGPGLLPIQGPPGAGKTYKAAEMIREALAAGLRIGVSANSHKVILKLLQDVQTAAEAYPCLHMRKELSEPPLPAWLQETCEYPEAEDAIRTGRASLLAGTAWLWSRPEFADSVDLLFIDEAGQTSLANALAMAPAARKLVLLGDPQQLQQPLKGTHPEGAAVSALQHVIGSRATLDPSRGTFLDHTYRLHPAICRFTSELFYDNLLSSRPGLENQRIAGHPALSGSGLRFFPVDHHSNQNQSPEEVHYVSRLIDSLLAPGVHYVDKDNRSRPLTPSDILIVAPYNAQVAALTRALPAVPHVGTVDKFQGQEAPIVIYSLTTSAPEDAPRGMEFLYSLNRLNVATSRARALSILVASPKLLDPQCKSPAQLRLANALCRYVELSEAVSHTAVIGPRLPSASAT